MKENNMICFVELKGSFDNEQLNLVFDMVRDVYDLSKCILQSFDFDNLVRTHEMIPDLPIMYTYGSRQNDYARCFEYGFSIDADYNAATPEMIKEFHDKGLEYGVWTANSTEAFEKCKALGVDYIESDFFGGND